MLIFGLIAISTIIAFWSLRLGITSILFKIFELIVNVKYAHLWLDSGSTERAARFKSAICRAASLEFRTKADISKSILPRLKSPAFIMLPDYS